MMTSAFEGFPMTLVEAQQCGVVPVVMDSYLSLHDIVETGYNGIIVSNEDLTGYINNIKRADDRHLPSGKTGNERPALLPQVLRRRDCQQLGRTVQRPKYKPPMISNVNKLIIWILLFSCCWGLLTPQFVLLPVILALFYMIKAILERQSGMFKKHLIIYFIFFHNQRIFELILRTAKPTQNIQLNCLPAIFHNSVLFLFSYLANIL